MTSACQSNFSSVLLEFQYLPNCNDISEKSPLMPGSGEWWPPASTHTERRHQPQIHTRSLGTCPVHVGVLSPPVPLPGLAGFTEALVYFLVTIPSALRLHRTYDTFTSRYRYQQADTWLCADGWC